MDKNSGSKFRSKEEFVVWLKDRTKAFAVRTIAFCNTLPRSRAAQVITYQLIKSVTSTAANYRAACRARSRAEFYAKLCIVVEEADESVFWFEIIKDSCIEVNQDELQELMTEAKEITALMTSSRKNAQQNRID